MTAATSPIQADTAPPVTEIAPGLWWARLPLPFALNHINVWLLRDRDAVGNPGWTVVDTGVSSRLGRSMWETLLATPLNGEPILKVIVTHFHPDHVGLADWLCARFGATLYMSQAEWLLARLLLLDRTEATREANQTFYETMDLEPEMLHSLVERSHAFAQSVPGVPAAYDRLRQGRGLDIGDSTWTVITSGGHAPEHVCLFNERDKLLIAGDMVLPRISPNISVWPAEPFADPLAEFLDGLRRLRRLPADTLVLPSHGEPFSDLHGRIDALISHHRDRLEDARQACLDTPRTIADITRMMFRRPLDTHQMAFATGEALAHLNYLVERGVLTRTTRNDGVLLFTAAADTAAD